MESKKLLQILNRCRAVVGAREKDVTSAFSFSFYLLLDPAVWYLNVRHGTLDRNVITIPLKLEIVETSLFATEKARPGVVTHVMS